MVQWNLSNPDILGTEAVPNTQFDHVTITRITCGMRVSQAQLISSPVIHNVSISDFNRSSRTFQKFAFQVQAQAKANRVEAGGHTTVLYSML